MVRSKTPIKPLNRRGSPEAIEKRRAARFFNDILGGGTARARLDGRTEKRRQRLLTELEAGTGRGGRELTPLDVLQHATELLELGETVSSLRKVAKARKAHGFGDDVVTAIERLHAAYAFRPEVYRFLGIDDDTLRSAGVLAAAAEKTKERTRS
ncbi:hypothetical protein BH09MYX1_BH09MYX1_45110 [soil metagenome]